MRATRWVLSWTVCAVAATVGVAAPMAKAADTASIGDRVWLDLDGDGVQDVGEPGIPGLSITATWYGPDSQPGGGDDVAYPVAMTDANGNYAVTDLPAGVYEVAVGGAPTDSAPTYDLDGTGTSGTAIVTVSEGATDVTADFGYVGSGAIGDFVWLDQDGDGVQDLGTPELPIPEFGIAGVDLLLSWHGADGLPGGGDDVSVPATTGDAGEYFVAGLPLGSYTVTVDPATLPLGVLPTFDNDGGADHSGTAILSDDEPIGDGVDFGYRGTSSIGDQVVWDVDASGGITPADRGLVGVPIIAVWFDPDGDPMTDDSLPFFTFTGEGGAYLFDGLPAGHFLVIAPSGGPGFDVTFDEDGGVDGSMDIELAAGTAHLSADAGYTGSGTIGDTVYFDLDGDGVQGSGETGVPGQRVDLVWLGCGCDPDDDIVVSTVTDASGKYLFEHLPDDADFQVVIVGGIADAATNTGDPDADDPEGLPNESFTWLDSFEEVTDDLDQDFGYLGAGTIGDTVWLDVNADGQRQPAEPGIGGVGVTLTFAGFDDTFDTFDDVAAATTTTDAAGAYRFDQLVAGRYRVVVTPPVATTPSADADADADGTSVLDLGLGETNVAQDFGVAGTGALSGTVFDDTDRDGTRDGGEPGVPGVSVVVVWNTGGGAVALSAVAAPGGPMTLSVVTGPDGSWSLDRLPPGSYTVSLDPATVPAGFNATTPADVALVLGPGGTASAAHGFAIQASPPVPPTTGSPTTPTPVTLPATGGNSGAPATAAVALLALGLAALGLARARRRPV